MVGAAVTCQLQQGLAGEKYCASAVITGYRQADLVAVEAQRLLIVCRPEEHPAGQDLHNLVSITSLGCWGASAAQRWHAGANEVVASGGPPGHGEQQRAAGSGPRCLSI